jgi:hypothetical protein
MIIMNEQIPETKTETLGVLQRELLKLLDAMNVPESRKDLDEQNINWLGRNLALQNSNHPGIDTARELLEKLGARLVI